MTADTKPPDGFSLRRWSRRKLEAARETASREPAPTIAAMTRPGENLPAAAAAPAALAPESPPALPPVESLTIDSDFTSFFQPQVDEAVKRQALKKLFSDPRFNVMDGLDVYIDDYTKSDPIPPDILERLVKGHFSFNPPAPPADPSSARAGDAIPAASATALPAIEAAPSTATASSVPATAPAMPDDADTSDPSEPAASR